MPEREAEELGAVLMPVLYDPAEKVGAVVEVSKVQKKINLLSEHALSFRIEQPENLLVATEMMESLREFGSTMESLIELFRKPAHEHYKKILAQKKELLEPVETAMAHLRDEVQRFKEEADRKLLEAKQKFAEYQTDEAAEALHVASETSEVEVDGLSYRTYWKAECVDLVALCKAIGDGKAPPSLVTFNQTNGNSLARSLRDVMRFPGVRVYSEKRPVLK